MEQHRPSGSGAAPIDDVGIDAETVAMIARDYLEAELPVREILKRHRLSCGVFYRLVKDNGWGRRRTRPRGRRRAANATTVMLSRLRTLAQRRIAALEKDATSDAEAGLAGHERVAKAIAALLGLLTRIEELQSQVRAGANAAMKPMTPEEADARRQKLAQMLVKMLEQASGQQLPGGG